MESTGVKHGQQNLPSWPGAFIVYGRVNPMLMYMATRGHVQRPKIGRGGKIVTPGWVSPEMEEVIDALNKGDEEFLKNFVLTNAHRVPDEIIYTDPVHVAGENEWPRNPDYLLRAKEQMAEMVSAMRSS